MNWFEHDMFKVFLHQPPVGSVIQESGQSPRSRRQQSRTAGGGKKGSELKRNGKPSALGELIDKEAAANSKSVPKKGTKEFKKRKGDDSPPTSQTELDSPVVSAKKAKLAKDDNTNGLAACRYGRTHAQCALDLPTVLTSFLIFVYLPTRPKMFIKHHWILIILLITFFQMNPTPPSFKVPGFMNTYYLNMSLFFISKV